MKKQIISGMVALAALWYSGCGGTQMEQENAGTEKQPHDTRVLGRAMSLEKDWSWNVEVRRDKGKSGYEYSYLFWDSLPKGVAHFQFFIDADNNPDTGFTGENGWEITGADYLIEDNDLYKYVETDDKGWRWEHDGSFVDFYITEDNNDVVTVKLSSPDFQLSYKASEVPAMMEVYDKNWNGDYPTVLGLTLSTQPDILLPPLPPGKIAEKEVRRYQDAAGHTILEQIHRNGKWVDAIKWQYNEQGLVSKKIFYATRTVYTYTYNEKGDLSRIVSGHRSIKVEKSFQTTYNEEGQKTEEKVTTKIYRMGVLKSTETDTYQYTYNTQGKVTEVIHDGDPYQKYTYDENGRVHTEIYFGNKNFVRKTIYTYDDQSRVIREESDRYADGTIERIRYYTYLPAEE